MMYVYDYRQISGDVSSHAFNLSGVWDISF
jgi:hypothetical protein